MTPVEPSRLEGLSRKALKRARTAPDGVTAWGTQRGKDDINVATWRAMQPGDWIFFYSDGHFPFAGRLLLREHSLNVAERLWSSDGDGTWEFMYLMDELRRIDVPRKLVLEALDYKSNFYPQGFMRVDRDLPSRFGSVERMLGELAETGEELKRVVDAIQDGDDLAATIASDRLANRISKSAAAAAVESCMTSGPPEVRTENAKRYRRNQRLVTNLKALYDGRCQCCDFTFVKADGEPYSEAAHLRRISLGEADLDVKDNLLVLCANHHRMLDFGAIEIEYDAAADELLLRRDGKVEKLTNKHIGVGRPKKKKRRKKSAG